jgi:hypothetical protein
VITNEKWMGSTPWQSLRCLAITCKISWSSNKVWEFHKGNGNMYQTSQHFGQTGEKNLKQLGNAIINSKKIHKWTRYTRVGSCKNSHQLEVRKHVNKNLDVGHQWCDTNCHTLIQKFITPKPDKINAQTLHQNNHEWV